jgi:hypothetical protein
MLRKLKDHMTEIFKKKISKRSEEKYPYYSRVGDTKTCGICLLNQLAFRVDY